MMPRYFFVTFMSPVGLAGNYIRVEKHPHHPDVTKEVQESAARFLTRLAGGQLINPELIMLTNVQELELEVAMARWPKDFYGDVPTPTSGACTNCTDASCASCTD